MENIDNGPVKIQDKLILKLFFGSLIVIISTLIGVMFNFEALREICVCISNYLAWSWIAFGLSAIFVLFILFLRSTSNIKPILYNFFMLLIILLMSSGIILLVLFGSRLLDVI